MAELYGAAEAVPKQRAASEGRMETPLTPGHLRQSAAAKAPWHYALCCALPPAFTADFADPESCRCLCPSPAHPRLHWVHSCLACALLPLMPTPPAARRPAAFAGGISAVSAYPSGFTLTDHQRLQPQAVPGSCGKPRRCARIYRTARTCARPRWPSWRKSMRELGPQADQVQVPLLHHTSTRRATRQALLRKLCSGI